MEPPDGSKTLRRALFRVRECCAVEVESSVSCFGFSSHQEPLVRKVGAISLRSQRRPRHCDLPRHQEEGRTALSLALMEQREDIADLIISVDDTDVNIPDVTVSVCRSWVLSITRSEMRCTCWRSMNSAAVLSGVCRCFLLRHFSAMRS